MVEVCTGLVAQIMFGSGPGSGLVQMIAIKLLQNILGFLGSLFFAKRVIQICAHLMLMTQLGS
jgi:hypothetical protein